MTECSHQIKVVNFQSRDVVTCPIVRLLGLIQTSNSSSCPGQDTIIVTLSRKITHIKATSRFKLLLELTEGPNEVTLQYGCSRMTLFLEYIPKTSQYTVMPLYVICEGHDGSFQAPAGEKCNVESACSRILLAARLLQCFTAEKLQENGLGRRTFSLEGKCEVFRSRLHYLQARSMSQEQLWECIGRDVMSSSLGSSRRKYLAFLSCTRYNGEKFIEDRRSHEEALKITEAYVALGGGGLALFGSASLHTWPEVFGEITARFEDQTVINRRELLDDSCYRGTYGFCFSTTLGSVLHELYHTFDLGHTDSGVMGRGFDHISRFFTSEEEEAPQEEILSRFGGQIEFTEELEADRLSERLLNEHKKKDMQVTRRFEDNDRTFLTKSCAVLLAYHRWFNSAMGPGVVTLLYDASSRFVKSTAGIRVVELRRQPEEAIGHSWTFEGKVLRFSFHLPDEALLGPLMLVVEDNFGNILKQVL